MQCNKENTSRLRTEVVTTERGSQPKTKVVIQNAVEGKDNEVAA